MLAPGANAPCDSFTTGYHSRERVDTDRTALSQATSALRLFSPKISDSSSDEAFDVVFELVVQHLCLPFVLG